MLNFKKNVKIIMRQLIKATNCIKIKWDDITSELQYNTIQQINIS